MYELAELSHQEKTNKITHCWKTKTFNPALPHLMPFPQLSVVLICVESVFSHILTSLDLPVFNANVHVESGWGEGNILRKVKYGEPALGMLAESDPQVLQHWPRG